LGKPERTKHPEKLGKEGRKILNIDYRNMFGTKF
jgi:hypothetical protein